MKGSLIILTACLMHAQHEHAASASGTAQLMDGLGDHTHPINTNSDLAQKFFD